MKKLTLLLMGLALVSFASAAHAQIDVELAFDPTEVMPGDVVHVFASIANLGDEAVVADIELTITFNEWEFGPFYGSLPLAAGEELSREFAFPVPHVPVGGDLTITITATAGEYSDTATATLTIIVDGDEVATGHTLDDLPGIIMDQIAVDEPEPVVSFSSIKTLY
jgi:hypothetical protein